MTYITTSNLYWDRFELDNLKQMRFTDEEIEKCTATFVAQIEKLFEQLR